MMEKTENKWFMDPDDSVKVDGHTFMCVCFTFDGTVMTQMSGVEVAGQGSDRLSRGEKAFTDGDDVMELSCFPLEEKKNYAESGRLYPPRIKLCEVWNAFGWRGWNLIPATGVLWKLRDRSYDDYEHYDTEGRAD